MLQKTARDFLEKECTENFVREMEEDEEGFSSALWSKIAGLGWLGLPFPEEYGGTGGTALDLAVLYEEMGRAMVPSPHLSTVVLCGLTILAAGSEEQKRNLLPRLVNGDLILALALTEPEPSWNGNGWDASGVTVRAIADGDDYVIDGSKLFVRDAHIADQLLVAARTSDGATPEEGVTLFLVDAASGGVACTPQAAIAGDKPSEVVFTQVRVPGSSMLGALGGGWAPLSGSLQVGAVMLSAEMVGAGQRALEIAVDYAKTRVQFEQPIGINQYVQEHCVNCLANVEASRWMTYRAAWKLSEGVTDGTDAAAAKAWTGDAHEKVCWHAHQVLAGAGYAEDGGVLPLLSRRGLAQKFYLGDADHHLRQVAEQVKQWGAPVPPRGKAAGLWNLPEERQVPAWKPWRDRFEQIQSRKEERRRRRAAR
jgi:alkylation response protein AidB-like acyl-CoA dehydrogenase